MIDINVIILINPNPYRRGFKPGSPLLDKDRLEKVFLRIQSNEFDRIHGMIDMQKVLKIFEQVIVISLLGLMMLAVLVSTIELGVILVQQLLKTPMLLLNMKEMMEVFGFFLMVLIGLELLETIKAYLHEDRVHAEVVFLVALVAVSRKVIILDYKDISPETLYGMAALVVALGIGYFLVRRSLCHHSTNKESNSSESK